MYNAIELLLDSELFTFHNERMVGLMMGDAQEVGDIWGPADIRTPTHTNCTFCITLYSTMGNGIHPSSGPIENGVNYCQLWARWSISRWTRYVVWRMRRKH